MLIAQVKLVKYEVFTFWHLWYTSVLQSYHHISIKIVLLNHSVVNCISSFHFKISILNYILGCFYYTVHCVLKDLLTVCFVKLIIVLFC